MISVTAWEGLFAAIASANRDFREPLAVATRSNRMHMVPVVVLQTPRMQPRQTVAEGEDVAIRNVTVTPTQVQYGTMPRT